MTTPVTTPRSARSEAIAGPIVVLTMILLIPAVLLWGTWRWAGGRADIDEDAVPAQAATPATVAPAEPALNTGLLSFRRSAGEMSRRLNIEAFQSAVQPLLTAVGDRSCAAVSLDGRLVGAANPDSVVIPASNQKILVAAVALEVLGESFRYTTELVGPSPAGGVVAGDVYLVGGGDPVLSGEWYPTSNLDRFQAFNTTSLDELARNLAAAGVSQIQGAVRGDGSRYDDEYFAPGWGGGVAGLEAGPYDALLVNDSRVLGDDQRGSDPSEAAAREFVRILSDQGIVVTGGSGAGVAPPDLTELASVESQPLPAVIAEMLDQQRQQHRRTDGEGDRTRSLRQRNPSGRARRHQLDDRRVGDRHQRTPVGGRKRAEPGQPPHLLDRCSGVLQHAGFESAVGRGMAVAGNDGHAERRVRRHPGGGPTARQDRHAQQPTVRRRPARRQGARRAILPIDGGGAIEYVLILNGPTISDQSEYRPIWAELVTALDSYPAVASPAALGPR